MLNSDIVECFNNIGILIDADQDNFILNEYILDSLTFVSMIVEIEEKFNVRITDEYLSSNSLETYKDIENMLDKLSS